MVQQTNVAKKTSTTGFAHHREPSDILYQEGQIPNSVLCEWIERHFDLESSKTAVRLRLKECSPLHNQPQHEHKWINLCASQEFGITTSFTPLIFAHWYAVSRKRCEHVTYDVNLKDLELDILTESEYYHLSPRKNCQVLHLDEMIANKGFHIARNGKEFAVCCGTTTVLCEIPTIEDASLCCEMFNEMLHLLSAAYNRTAAATMSETYEESADGLAVVYHTSDDVR